VLQVALAPDKARAEAAAEAERKEAKKRKREEDRAKARAERKAQKRLAKMNQLYQGCFGTTRCARRMPCLTCQITSCVPLSVRRRHQPSGLRT
jgi:hypothetical protein